MFVTDKPDKNYTLASLGYNDRQMVQTLCPVEIAQLQEVMV